MCADGLSSYHANQMSGVYVSCLAPISLAKAASPVGGSWNAKIISIAEEKQPVGMFPLGCLEWINLSNCLSSVDILYTHRERARNTHTNKQASKFIQIRHLHTCITHTFTWCAGHFLSSFLLFHLHFLILLLWKETRNTHFSLIVDWYNTYTVALLRRLQQFLCCGLDK